MSFNALKAIIALHLQQGHIYLRRVFANEYDLKSIERAYFYAETHLLYNYAQRTLTTGSLSIILRPILRTF